MPGLPSNKNNRPKATKPVLKRDPDHVMQRKLDALGFELINRRQSLSMEEGSAPDPASVIGGWSLNILDLPIETQKEIFKHASNTDLIALSLVNKHFRDVAAEQLYRSFHITFLDDGDISQDSPVDQLAGGLDTFVTSTYDYAQYLREIILEPVNAGERNERAYRYFKYDSSCGKFMNTLLLLTLRKAKALENFRWDIRVELSRDVLKALHQITSIHHLHLRMQPGRSIYQAPPAIPASPASPSGWSTSTTTSSVPPPLPNYTSSHNHHGGPIIVVPLNNFPPNPYSSSSNSITTTPTSSKSSIKSAKQGKTLLPAIKTKLPTLSGFRNLKSLAIVDMDTHDYINELKICLKECSSTLHTLKLSFSENLANKARKPLPEPISSDESELDDEFGQPIIQTGPPALPNPASDPNGPSKAIKALEEKKKQEAVLGLILGIEVLIPKPKNTRTTKRPPPPPPATELHPKDPKRTFITNLLPLATKLMGYTNTADNDSPTEAQEILDIISSAAKKYLETDDNEKEKQEVGASSKESKLGDKIKKVNGIKTEALLTEIDEGPGLFDKPDTKKKIVKEFGDADPDDINMDEPQYPELAEGADEMIEDSTQETLEEVEESIGTTEPDPTALTTQHEVDMGINATINNTKLVNGDGDISSPEAENMLAQELTDDGLNKSRPSLERASSENPIEWANRQHILSQTMKVAADSGQLSKDVQKMRDRWEELNAKKLDGHLSEADYLALVETRADLQSAIKRADEITQKISETDDRLDDLSLVERSRMTEYVRETRGLTLTTLAIYLIPLKASILSRGVDLTVLQDVTLLNVGPQIPFWNLMAKENKQSPLPLRKIYTDNVTLPLLVFVSQLEVVTDLFLLERSTKARVENTAKTTVTIEQIRKIVLKKHVATLRRLMIKHDSLDWDLNTKTVLLLCQRAITLEELACCFSISTVHTFLQFVTGLTSLRILHMINFRAEDTCHTVMREVRRFIVDTVSHHPKMKLEYLALESSGAVGVDSQVFRFVRRKSKPKTSIKVDKKGKGKETTSTWAVNGTIGSSPSSLWGLDTQIPSGLDLESSDDESEKEGYKVKGLQLETMGGLRFSDIAGVRIFEKDIISGRL